ncbi:E3 ubiquitin-protein ligase TRIM39-like isoform X2 [Mobula birostris]|uniref:E3 ubiquitin-protein ligase TRIM39-like isoform X2 n=1 Tax=Mobula birostris TaxID=1983395 RepID=UPI003B28709C
MSEEQIGAMASESEMDGLIEELTCPICLEIFVDPVSLQCGHHFCRPCITHSLGQLPEQNTCPQCRQTFSGVNTRSARRLGIIAEQVKVLNAKLAHEKQEPCCAEHGEKLKQFCLKEREVICVNCWDVRHQGHKVIPMKVAVGLYKKAFKEVLPLFEGELQMVTENKMKQEGKVREVKVQVDQLSERIEREFSKMHYFLEEQEKAMRCQLRENENRTLKRLDTIVAEINNDVSTLEERILEIKSRLEMNQTVKILKDAENLLTTCDVQCQEVEEFDIRLTSKILDGLLLPFLRVWEDMRRIIEADRETENEQLFVS